MQKSQLQSQSLISELCEFPPLADRASFHFEKGRLSPPSQLPLAAHVHRHAAALFDPLHLTVPERGLQVRAVQLHGELGDAVRPAEGAGLERLLRLVVALPSGAHGLTSVLALTRVGAHVPGNIEGVALAVAKTVDHGATAAALLADCLTQGLGLAPVPAKVAPLRHHQGLPAGRQHRWFLLQ